MSLRYHCFFLRMNTKSPQMLRKSRRRRADAGFPQVKMVLFSAVQTGPSSADGLVTHSAELAFKLGAEHPLTGGPVAL